MALNKTTQSVVPVLEKKDIKAIEKRVEEGNAQIKSLLDQENITLNMLHPKKDAAKISQLASKFKKQLDEIKRKMHLDKCILKTLSYFETTPEKIDAFLKNNIESGLDGYPVEDIIGRHGYFDGKQKSRVMVAEFYKKQPYTIELVEQKIKTLLKKQETKPTSSVGTL